MAKKKKATKPLRDRIEDALADVSAATNEVSRCYEILTDIIDEALEYSETAGE